MAEVMAWIGTIFFPAFIILAIFHWYTHVDLEYEKDMREVDIKFKERYKEECLKEYGLHKEWEHKYNQLLKNFQRYIDEHDPKQHHCNCCKKRDDEDQEEHKQHQCNQGIHSDFSSVKFTDEQIGQLTQKIMGQFKQEMLERDVPVNNHMLPHEEREILKELKKRKQKQEDDNR